MVDYNSLEPVKDASQIKIGDTVCLEVRIGDDILPRWNNNYEASSSGKWIEVKVINILETQKEFQVSLPDKYSWKFEFKLYCDQNGRNKDGWPRLQTYHKKEASPNVCTCSTYVICNIGCPSNHGLKCPDRQDV